MPTTQAQGWLTPTLDSISQFLTTSPLWIQAPLTMIVIIPLCAIIALVWLRFIDLCAAYLTGTKRTKPKRPTTAGHKPAVIHGHFDQKDTTHG